MGQVKIIRRRHTNRKWFKGSLLGTRNGLNFFFVWTEMGANALHEGPEMSKKSSFGPEMS